MKALRLAPAVFALSLALGFAQEAAAQAQRVVIEDFGGPQGSSLRTSLVQNFQEQGSVEVVSSQEVRASARGLGIRRSTFRGDEYAQVAQQLGVSAFVRGTVSRNRGGWTLTVTVRNGFNGRVAGSATWSGRTVQALGGIRRNGYRRLARFISSSQTPNQEAGETPPQEGGEQHANHPREGGSREGGTREGGETPPNRPLRPPEPLPDGSTPWWAAGNDRGWNGGRGQDEEENEDEQIDFSRVDPDAFQEPGEEEEIDDDFDFDEDFDDDEGGGFSYGSSRIDWLNISLLGGTLRRSLSAIALVRNNGRDASMPEGAVVREQRIYQSAGIGHGEIGVQAELYPGAIGPDQEVPWFGFVGTYRHSVFLSTLSCPIGGCMTSAGFQAPISVPTAQSELMIAGRARHRFGEEPDSPRIMADVGFGMFNFDLDPGTLMMLASPNIVPPLSYSFIHLGLTATVGLVPRYLTVGATAGYRIGLGIGADAKKIWGVDTQPGSGFTFGGLVHSEAPYIAEGVYFELNVQYFVFTTTFRGKTSCANPPTCGFTDPWEAWPMEGDSLDGPVTGGIQEPVNDTYLRLGLAIGYSFR